jgi:Squalene-hopene cyclase C-terminal domain/Prenyltransferase and squalene oxidase repeat
VRGVALTIAVWALLVASPAPGEPLAPPKASLDLTVRYLQGVQQPSGGFGGAGEPSQISSAWTALALAAAGINPQDQARPGGVDAYGFLASHFQQGVEESECAPVACTTTFERELMVVNASGTSPHDFGGVDLLDGLLGRARPDGSFPHAPGGQPGVNDTIFAIFALDPIPDPAAQGPIQRAANWVESVQHDNGGWSWSASSSLDEVDMTGAAIQALVAAGRAGDGAVQKGVAYLHAAENPDGGFPQFPGDPESNVASTAWAAQAIWSVGENPETWLSGGGEETEEPLDYLESLQEADGHIRWKRSADLNGVWMTAYVAPAFAGQAWPIPVAPRAAKQAPSSAQPGQGEGTQSGRGVIAGGGSAGAPLFSRPKPQSKGKTPGGARVLHSEAGEVRNHSKTRRGEHARQPTATVSAEPTNLRESRGGPAEGGPAATPAPPASGAAAGQDDGRGREVAGTLVGTGASHGRPLAFGAPGLHSAGTDTAHPSSLAIAIGAAALLLVFAGARLEGRRPGAFA